MLFRSDSVAAALQVMCLLGQRLDAGHVAPVLANLELPGRCQRVHWRNLDVWLDVAHNPAAVAYLALRLSQSDTPVATAAVFAAMSDKDIRGMIAPVLGLVDYWYACALPGVARAAGSDVIHAALNAEAALDAQSSADVGSALEDAALRLGAGGRIVVFGSFFTVAAALTALTADADA